MAGQTLFKECVFRRDAASRVPTGYASLHDSFSEIGNSSGDSPISLIEIGKSRREIPISLKEIHKSKREIGISLEESSQPEADLRLAVSGVKKNPKRKRGPMFLLWPLLQKNREVGPRLRFGFFLTPETATDLGDFSPSLLH